MQRIVSNSASLSESKLNIRSRDKAFFPLQAEIDRPDRHPDQRIRRMVRFLCGRSVETSLEHGTEAVVRAPADGYTLLLGAAGNLISPSLYDNLNFNFIRLQMRRPPRCDCVAGQRGLELRNVMARYPFERSHRFPGMQPNSGHRDYSRSSCGVEDTQLGPSARISAAACVAVGQSLR